METIIGYTKCECGALTVHTESGEDYSFLKSHKKIFFPTLDLRKVKKYNNTCMCDHCVNHYGLDLCGCGSGAPFGKCHNNLKECFVPMQSLGEYTKIQSYNALHPAKTKIMIL